MSNFEPAMYVDPYSSPTGNPVSYDLQVQSYHPIYYDADFTWTGTKGKCTYTRDINSPEKTDKITSRQLTSSDVASSHSGDINADEEVIVYGVSDPNDMGYVEATARYLYPTSQRVLKSVECLGSWVGWILGLHRSRFQYAVDESKRVARIKEYKQLMKNKQKEQHFLMKGLQGMDDPDEDISDIPYVPLPFTVLHTIYTTCNN
eukprot:Tbor_TRINITY_DN3590_c0_g1::TRINITY_DN3590_c0_g1_i1::g.2911::m.2911